MATGDAGADHGAFTEAGLSAGSILAFSRPFVDAAGTKDAASFRLAFASDTRYARPVSLYLSEVNAHKSIAALAKACEWRTRIAQIIVAASKPDGLADLLIAGAKTHVGR